MLVLSRQRDETIMIGDDVEITVVDIRGDKVRLGINAPRHIQVHRKEVYDAIKRENQQAAKLSPRDVSEVVEHDAEKDKAGKGALEVEKKEPQKESPDAGKNNREKESGEHKRLNNPHRPNQTGRSR